MKTLVNPPLEKNIVVVRPPLWRRISAERLYWLLSMISPLLALLTWQFICSLQIFPTQILVPPATVWNTFMSLLQSGFISVEYCFMNPITCATNMNAPKTKQKIYLLEDGLNQKNISKAWGKFYVRNFYPKIRALM